MKEVIEKAIDAGYVVKPFEGFLVRVIHHKRGWNEAVFDHVTNGATSNNDILLDPLFWQALGKALGWEDIKTNPKNISWLEHWHNFIDHIVAQGKNPEDFFTTLLANKQ